MTAEHAGGLDLAALEDDICDALMAAKWGRYDGRTVTTHLEGLLRTVRLAAAEGAGPVDGASSPG
jgi:hypothetical protein